jgi:integrase/recombinase XerD
MREAGTAESTPPSFAVLTFLYGTAARIDETLALAHGDVDLRNGTATFRRFTRCARTIPIGPGLCHWLRAYSVSDRNEAQSFFARKDGKAIHPRMLLRTFESVRRRAGVTRLDGMGCQPRLRDLRRTFAVHCLEEWIEQKRTFGACFRSWQQHTWDM